MAINQQDNDPPQCLWQLLEEVTSLSEICQIDKLVGEDVTLQHLLKFDIIGAYYNEFGLCQVIRKQMEINFATIQIYAEKFPSDVNNIQRIKQLLTILKNYDL